MAIPCGLYLCLIRKSLESRLHPHGFLFLRASPASSVETESIFDVFEYSEGIADF